MRDSVVTPSAVVTIVATTAAGQGEREIRDTNDEAQANVSNVENVISLQSKDDVSEVLVSDAVDAQLTCEGDRMNKDVGSEETSEVGSYITNCPVGDGGNRERK